MSCVTAKLQKAPAERFGCLTAVPNFANMQTLDHRLFEPQADGRSTMEEAQRLPVPLGQCGAVEHISSCQVSYVTKLVVWIRLYNAQTALLQLRTATCAICHSKLHGQLKKITNAARVMLT